MVSRFVQKLQGFAKLTDEAVGVMAGEFWLSDRQWAAIAPLLPDDKLAANFASAIAIAAILRGWT